jgi:aspartyl-tRNA(Asn)/glutamyl-tRNA(Gln) amidotransferase subunit A
MLQILSAPDARDAFALTAPFEPPVPGRDLRGLRIGVTADFGVASPRLDADVAGAVVRAAQILKAAGADIVEIEPQWPVAPLEPFLVLWEATYAGFLETAYPAEKVARMDPALLAIAERGRRIDMGAYHRALLGRARLRAAAKRLFDDVDLLVGPVMPCRPPLAADDAPPGYAPGDWSWCPFTSLWNMTGQPAASAPMGLDRGGLPLGVQIVGWDAAEPAILRAIEALACATAAARPDLGALADLAAT